MPRSRKASPARDRAAPRQHRQEEAIRPRRSLRWKMLMWMWLMALMPMAVSIVLFQHVIRKELASAYSSDATLFCNVLAASLSGKLAGEWERPVGQIIDRVKEDPRVAFVIVADEHGRPVHVGAFQGDAWSAYIREQQRAGGMENALTLDGHRSMRTMGDLIVQQAPIRRTTNGGDPAGDVIGHVVLGLRNRDLGAGIEMFEMVQIGTVAGAFLLCMPLAFWVTRRWVGPLRALIESIRELGRGGQATPVPIHGDDEISVVSMAFNDMAGRLAASRTELREANETLENRVAERTAQLSDAVHRLEVMALTDPMTGLANRRAFRDALGDLFVASELNGDELNCVMVDLDGFKGVNDTLGHDKGDELIQLAADVLREVTRHVDVTARLGGDEFVVLLPKISEADAIKVAQRMLERFEQCSGELFADVPSPPRVTMSIGVSSYRRNRPRGADELLKQADAALYDAKGGGKACVKSYRGGHDGTQVAGAA